MSPTDAIKTVYEPESLALYSHCGLYTTLDNYDPTTKQCLECRDAEVQDDPSK